MLPVVVPEHVVERLWDLLDREPTTAVTVDLEAGEVRTGDDRQEFTVPGEVRRRLLPGLDDIGIALEHRAAIEAYEAARRPALPRTGRIAQHA